MPTLGKVCDAIIAGIPADQVKDRMLALDTRRLQLETDLTKEPAPSPIRIHPTMAAPYRTRIGALIRRLQAPDGMLEATEALRGLLERTVLQPALNTGRLSAHLQGALAGILSLSLGGEGRSVQQKTSCEEEVMQSIVILVAGGRNRRNLPKLFCIV